MKLENVHVVLMRVRNPMNLGAVARAMKNFGLARLTLVAPLTDDLATARAVAVHAGDILDRLQRAESLQAAVASARWVVGTSQKGLPGQPVLDVPTFAAEAGARTDQGELALIFGDEQSGLSHADMLACHAVSSIATGPEQGSLNLAQAAVVYGHALFSHAGPPVARALEPRADERGLQQVEAALRALLQASGFADPDRPGHGVAELAQVLRRAGLSGPEARLWVAALRGAERKIHATVK